MATLRLTCPFCSEATRLQLMMPTGWRSPKLSEVALVKEKLFSRFRDVRPEQEQTVLNNNFKLFFALAHCPECNEYSVLKAVSSAPAEAFNGGARGEDFSAVVTPLRLSPQSEAVLPAEIPSELSTVLLELDEDFKRGRNAGRILAGCRSVLDVALHRLDGGASGARAARIAALRDAGRLTSDIAEWARRLWVDGHDGVHELDAKNHPVAEHLAFLRMFMEVAFVIPEKIKQGQI